MNAVTRSIHRVVLVTDLEEHSAAAFVQALGVAVQARAALFLLHVVDPERPAATWRRLPTVRALLESWGRLSPGATEADFHQLGVEVHLVERRLLHRDLRERISHEVAALNPDLVLLSPAVLSRLGETFGAAPEPVARDVRLPALYLPTGARPLVSPATGAWKVRRVVVPVGPRTESAGLLAATEQLLGGMACQGVHVVLVHVGSWSTAPLDRLPSRAGWTFRMEVRTGGIVEQLRTAIAACDADLVVMGAFEERSLRSRMLGSIAGRLLRRAERPFLLLPLPLPAGVRPQVWRTPPQRPPAAPPPSSWV
jgi:nucleotide-binding universal stress UspA family protein